MTTATTLARGVAHPVLAAAAFLVASASGRANAGDVVHAQALFGEGRQLARAGDYTKACPLFEASYRLDPGMGTLFNLADCEEHLGRTATAWALFLEVAAATRATGQTVRERTARERASALEPKLARMSVQVLAQDTEGLEVFRDGTPLGASEWGLVLPLDPGPHTVLARAPGRITFETSVVIPDGPSTTVFTVPQLEGSPAVTAEHPAPPPLRPVAPPHSPSEVVPPPAPALGSQRTAALAFAGSGIVGIGVGAAFGILAWKKHDDSVSQGCNANNVCSSEASRSSRDAAISAGTISTIAMGVGLVSVAVATALWFTTPQPRRSASAGIFPVLASDGASMFGRF